MDPLTYRDELGKEVSESFREEIPEEMERIEVRFEVVPGGAVLRFDKPIEDIFFSKKGCKGLGKMLTKRGRE